MSFWFLVGVSFQSPQFLQQFCTLYTVSYALYSLQIQIYPAVLKNNTNMKKSVNDCDKIVMKHKISQFVANNRIDF